MGYFGNDTKIICELSVWMDS